MHHKYYIDIVRRYGVECASLSRYIVKMIANNGYIDMVFREYAHAYGHLSCRHVENLFRIRCKSEKAKVILQ